MDEPKNFDEEKRTQALQWLNDKLPNLTCECCQQKAWTIAPSLVNPMTFSDGGMSLVIGGITYPQVMLACTNCGNTKYFNAVVMGIVQNDSKEGENGN